MASQITGTFDCLLNRLFRRISKKASKFRVTGFCEGNPSVTGGFPSQRASNAEHVSIWWRYHTITCSSCCRSLPNCIWHSINLTATKWHRNVFAILVTIYLKPISLAKILTRTNEQESSLNVHEGRHFFNWPEKNPIRFVVSRVPTRRSDA